MSTSAAVATTTPTTPALLTALEQTFTKLDTFANENSITTILEGNGSFLASLKLASAMVQLREMLTPEVMKPIMDLQGSALGFRTDKDKEGGYPMAVVKEVLIEATMKGFRMVANETNIIGGRFYAARDGFERIFRDLGKQGTLTDLRLTPSVPKTTADGAVVEYAASWVFKGKKDELKLVLPIRVNSGQGPDAILGKAKRKMLAAIYSRITGTEITDGDVDDPRTIDTTATPVPPEKPATPSPLPADVHGHLEELLTPHEAAANAYLVSTGAIVKGQTFRNVTEAMARKILKQTPGFFTAAGIKSGG